MYQTQLVCGGSGCVCALCMQLLLLLCRTGFWELARIARGKAQALMLCCCCYRRAHIRGKRCLILVTGCSCGALLLPTRTKEIKQLLVVQPPPVATWEWPVQVVVLQCGGVFAARSVG